MSYNILENSSSDLLEGIVFIQSQYSYYDKDTLEDTYFKEKYSVQMIEKSLKGLIDMEKIYKIIIFDILIGNSDRHHSNWAIRSMKKIEKETNMLHISLDVCPLYDNGSSLCAYENNNDLEIFFRDKMKFESLVNTKSKSAIGWKNERPIRHFELLRKIKETSYSLTINYIKKIRDNINDENLEKILNKFDNTVINEDMKRLLKMFLIERRNRMIEIYELNEKEG